MSCCFPTLPGPLYCAIPELQQELVWFQTKYTKKDIVFFNARSTITVISGRKRFSSQSHSPLYIKAVAFANSSIKDSTSF